MEVSNLKIMKSNPTTTPKIARTGSLMTEILGALMIIGSPTLIGAAVGGYWYASNPNQQNQWLFGALTGLGLFLGIWSAVREWKSRGTVWFISRLISTPELDKKD